VLFGLFIKDSAFRLVSKHDLPTFPKKPTFKIFTFKIFINMTKIVVCNEWVLGYVGQDETFHPLRSLVSKGGAFFGTNSVPNCFKHFQSVRLATSGDFEAFGVVESGYRADTSFTYNRAK